MLRAILAGTIACLARWFALCGTVRSYSEQDSFIQRTCFFAALQGRHGSEFLVRMSIDSGPRGRPILS
jgi:hypothetical protein